MLLALRYRARTRGRGGAGAGLKLDEKSVDGLTDRILDRPSISLSRCRHHMKPVKLPVAPDGIKEFNSRTNNVGSPRFATNLSHSVRPRRSSVIMESLGCLSLLEADTVPRPRAFPTPGTADENFGSFIRAQPTVRFRRPRAVLSSAQNDDLICEIPGPKEKAANTAINTREAPLPSLVELPKAILSSFEELPKALLSLDEDLLSVGKEATCVATESLIDHDLNVLTSIKDGAVVMESKSATFNGEKPKQPAGGMFSEHKFARQNAIEDHFANANGITSQMLRKHIILPSNASKIHTKQGLDSMEEPEQSARSPLLQHPFKSKLKDISGRVTRPWY